MRIFAYIAAMALASIPAFAQTTVGPEYYTPAEIAQTAVIDQAMDFANAGIYRPVKQLEKNNAANAAEQRARIDAVVHNKDYLNDLRNGLANLYTDHLTKSEFDHMERFFTTPAGKYAAKLNADSAAGEDKETVRKKMLASPYKDKIQAYYADPTTQMILSKLQSKTFMAQATQQGLALFVKYVGFMPGMGVFTNNSLRPQ